MISKQPWSIVVMAVQKTVRAVYASMSSSSILIRTCGLGGMPSLNAERHDTNESIRAKQYCSLDRLGVWIGDLERMTQRRMRRSLTSHATAVASTFGRNVGKSFRNLPNASRMQDIDSTSAPSDACKQPA